MTLTFVTDARECFDLLNNNTMGTASEPFFLSILQHLLSIRDDVLVRWAVNVRLSISLSIYLFIHLAIHPSFHPSIRDDIFIYIRWGSRQCMCLSLSVCLSIHPSIHLSIHQRRHLCQVRKQTMYVSLSICLSIYPSIHPSFHPSETTSLSGEEADNVNVYAWLSISIQSIHPSLEQNDMQICMWQKKIFFMKLLYNM